MYFCSSLRVDKSSEISGSVWKRGVWLWSAVTRGKHWHLSEDFCVPRGEAQQIWVMIRAQTEDLPENQPTRLQNIHDTAYYWLWIISPDLLKRLRERERERHTERERQRERERHTHTHTHTERERAQERERARERASERARRARHTQRESERERAKRASERGRETHTERGRARETEWERDRERERERERFSSVCMISACGFIYWQIYLGFCLM